MDDDDHHDHERTSLSNGGQQQHEKAKPLGQSLFLSLSFYVLLEKEYINEVHALSLISWLYLSLFVATVFSVTLLSVPKGEGFIKSDKTKRSFLVTPSLTVLSSSHFRL